MLLLDDMTDAQVKSLVLADHGALCAQTDPDIFFPEKGGSTKATIGICSRCEVFDACLRQTDIVNAELSYIDIHGIRAGMGAKEQQARKARLAGEVQLDVPEVDDLIQLISDSEALGVLESSNALEGAAA